MALEVDAPEYGPNVSHTLHGVKWFASAIDGDIALALARAGECGVWACLLGAYREHTEI